MKPIVIVLEGNERSGKSTLTGRLLKRFSEHSVTHTYEPGSNFDNAARLLRNAIFNDYNSHPIDPFAAQFAFLSSRIQQDSSLLALKKQIIIKDRSLVSSFVYFAGDCNPESFVSNSEMEMIEIHKWLIKIGKLIIPDFVFYLDTSYNVAMERSLKNPKSEVNYYDEMADKKERYELINRMYDKYIHFLEDDLFFSCIKFVRIKTDEKTQEEIADQVFFETIRYIKKRIENG